ncbi:hypothetical protein CLI92_09060 [Vandammella animalimorsus]|uniref:Holin n=1 Tax=Vandammella animalimorsus TaxID=2029117 RepID=A0A2A2T4K0_9BURK|nr:holin [Vandammella animalimorsus]PAT31881.1 hypothetical protein CK626_07745 [Vandammella animalimorsus]PAX16472.1 hypothetical protein CLI92_09060 [Vandammella animalimorsus]PAX18887.1 hypothetical protein CLI93_11140 [Vandammella animalimorsus]
MFRKTASALAVLYGPHARTDAQQAAASHVLASAGAKTWMAGAGSTAWSWILSNQFLGLVGAIAAILGLAANIYFRRQELAIKREYAARRDKREQELHDSKMLSRYAGGGDEEGGDD